MRRTGTSRSARRLRAAALTAFATLAIAGGVAAATLDTHPAATASLAGNTPWTSTSGPNVGVQR